MFLAATVAEGAAPAGASPAPVVVAPAAPAAAEARPVLDQRAIFEILCGGATSPSPHLSEHLWRVAGSLAAQSWTPPQVRVRVVAHAAPR